MSAPDRDHRAAALMGTIDPAVMDHFRVIWLQGIPFLEALVPGSFRVLLTTRAGGDSAQGFAGLNLSYWVGDDPTVVDRNHLLLDAALGLATDDVILPWQVHGLEVLELDECRRRGDRVPCDGLILRAPRDRGRAALMLSGDCLTVILLGRESCALVHAGWRGLLAGILQLGVEAMGTDRPEAAWFGPAIGPCCYTVGQDVADELVERYGPGAATAGPRLDLWAAAVSALGEAGVPVDGVVNPRICTSCHHDLFYSHRVDGPATGRHTAVAWISEQTAED